MADYTEDYPGTENPREYRCPGDEQYVPGVGCVPQAPTTTTPNTGTRPAAPTCAGGAPVWSPDPTNSNPQSGGNGGFWFCPDAGDPGGGGPSVPNFDDLFAAYGGPREISFEDIPGAPRFDAPDFQAPTAEGIYADPSYQFRLGEGQKALERSAAGRGVLRTGGTLKDILSYGQNFASQEYGNIFDRAARNYDYQYRAARDEWSPTFLEWQTKASASQRAKELAFQRAWDEYVFSQQMKFNYFDSFQDSLNAGNA